MRYSSVLALLAAVAVTNAQLQDIPQCGQNCLINALSADGCSSLLDFKCHCEKPGLISQVTPCVQKACQPADQAKVQAAAVSACAAAGVTLTGLPTITSGGSSASKTASASATSSAASTSASASAASSSASASASASAAMTSASASASASAASSTAASLSAAASSSAAALSSAVSSSAAAVSSSVAGAATSAASSAASSAPAASTGAANHLNVQGGMGGVAALVAAAAYYL